MGAVCLQDHGSYQLRQNWIPSNDFWLSNATFSTTICIVETMFFFGFGAYSPTPHLSKAEGYQDAPTVGSDCWAQLLAPTRTVSPIQPSDQTDQQNFDLRLPMVDRCVAHVRLSELQSFVPRNEWPTEWQRWLGGANSDAALGQRREPQECREWSCRRWSRSDRNWQPDLPVDAQGGQEHCADGCNSPRSLENRTGTSGFPALCSSTACWIWWRLLLQESQESQDLDLLEPLLAWRTLEQNPHTDPWVCQRWFCIFLVWHPPFRNPQSTFWPFGQADQRISFYNGTAAVSLGLLTGGHGPKLRYHEVPMYPESGNFWYVQLCSCVIKSICTSSTAQGGGGSFRIGNL